MVTDTAGERKVSIIEVCGTPGERPSVEGYEEDSEAVGLCTLEELEGEGVG